MKYLNKYIVVLATLFLSMPVFAGQERGAGKRAVIEFLETIDRSMTVLMDDQQRILNYQRQFSDLWAGIESVTVTGTKKQLDIDKEPADAINDPVNRSIAFNIEAWSKLTPLGRIAMVIHELMGLMRIPDEAGRSMRWAQFVHQTDTLQAHALEMNAKDGLIEIHFSENKRDRLVGLFSKIMTSSNALLEVGNSFNELPADFRQLWQGETLSVKAIATQFYSFRDFMGMEPYHLALTIPSGDLQRFSWNVYLTDPSATVRPVSSNRGITIVGGSGEDLFGLLDRWPERETKVVKIQDGTEWSRVVRAGGISCIEYFRPETWAAVGFKFSCSLGLQN